MFFQVFLELLEEFLGDLECNGSGVIHSIVSFFLFVVADKYSGDILAQGLA